MHPDLFSAFVDIAGDAGPNAGTKEQTITRLFGGNAAAWAAFDPATVITRHGRYRGVSGWFVVAEATNRDANAGGQDVAAHTLCAIGGVHGIDCAVVTEQGKHDGSSLRPRSRRLSPGWPGSWTVPECHTFRCRSRH